MNSLAITAREKEKKNKKKKKSFLFPFENKGKRAIKKERKLTGKESFFFFSNKIRVLLPSPEFLV